MSVEIEAVSTPDRAPHVLVIYSSSRYPSAFCLLPWRLVHRCFFRIPLCRGGKGSVDARYPDPILAAPPALRQPLSLLATMDSPRCDNLILKE